MSEMTWRKNVLFVSSMYPWPLDTGTRQRIFHILAGIAVDNDVTLVTFSDIGGVSGGEDDSPLHTMCGRIIEIDSGTQLCRHGSAYSRWSPLLGRLLRFGNSRVPVEVRGLCSPEMQSALNDLARREQFDAVWVERTPLAEMAHRAGLAPMVVDLDDIESHSFARELSLSRWYVSKPLHYAELWKWRRYERSLARRYARLVVCKEEDRSLFGKHLERVSVVPNGTAGHPPSPSALAVQGRLLFVGSMYYAPNVDAASFFVREVLPSIRNKVPAANLEIVGREPPPQIRALSNGCISVHPNVPTLDAHYDGAAVVVAPIRLGSGTRLKVLEALARGKAVVATSVAAEGLELRPGIDLEIADDPQEFADRCAALLGDGQRREALGMTGRARVLQRYHWDRIGRLAASILDSVVPDQRKEAATAVSS